MCGRGARAAVASLVTRRATPWRPRIRGGRFLPLGGLCWTGEGDRAPPAEPQDSIAQLRVLKAAVAAHRTA